jgi:hypothetical protein
MSAFLCFTPDVLHNWNLFPHDRPYSKTTSAGPKRNSAYKFPQHSYLQANDFPHSTLSGRSKPMSQPTDSCKAEASHHEHNIGLSEIDTEAEKRLVRKIDLFLMPSMFILYLLSDMVGHKSRPILDKSKHLRIVPISALRRSPVWKKTWN